MYKVINSKSIYSLENQKVIKNTIDSVKVPTNSVSSKNDYEVNVYNGDFFVKGNSLNKTTNENQKDFYRDRSYGDMQITGEQYSLSYLKNTVGYFETQIKIPRFFDGKFVQALYNGNKYDENGTVIGVEDVIKFSVSGTLKTSSVSASVSTNDGGVFDNTLPLNNIEYSNQKVVSQVFSYPEMPIIVRHELQGTFADTEVVGLNNETSYNILDYSRDDDYITVNVKILGYLFVEEMTGGYQWYKINDNDERPEYIAMNGTSSEYICDKITVSAYGNTIGIEVSDQKYTQGDNKNPFSISGSELMQQTDNENAVKAYERVANDVISNYKNGKETATIRCSVSDYFDGNGNLVISPTQFSNAEEITGSVKQNFIDYYGGAFRVPYTSGFQQEWFEQFSKVKLPRGLSKIVAKADDKTHGFLRISVSELPYAEIGFVDVDFNKEVLLNSYTEKDYWLHFNRTKPSIDGAYPAFNFNIFVQSQLPMVFEIGDEVIPMTRKPSGKDEPMSLYTDGTPKVFNVVGRKMIYDGAVWQELTLQEKTMDEGKSTEYKRVANEQGGWTYTITSNQFTVTENVSGGKTYTIGAT